MTHGAASKQARLREARGCRLYIPPVLPLHLPEFGINHVFVPVRSARLLRLSRTPTVGLLALPVRIDLLAELLRGCLQRARPGVNSSCNRERERNVSKVKGSVPVFDPTDEWNAPFEVPCCDRHRQQPLFQRDPTTGTRQCDCDAHAAAPTPQAMDPSPERPR